MKANASCEPKRLALFELRQSVRVATLAEAWDCDVTQINRLIDIGELEAHGLGRRARRVYLDSARDYQTRKAISPTGPGRERIVDKHRHASLVDNVAHRAAMATLRKQGIV